MKKVTIVTGGTSGIGLAAAQALAKSGWTVHTFSRRGSTADGLCHHPVDVTDEAAVSTAVEQIAAVEGRLDLVVHCACFGISGAVEFTETDDARRLFETNFFGAVQVNKAVIAHLRKTKGRIIHVSSVAAPAAIPFQTYYSASKAAVNAYSMALANELRPFGISVCAVMPGDIRTGFTAAREKSIRGNDLYAGRIERSVGRMERDEQNGMSPDTVGAFLCRVAHKRSIRPLYTIGLSYRLVCLLIRLLPASLVNRIIYTLYAS